jgi:3-hydroxyisobutyrate dehydrogenase-like beta-hydroxyacid dehydrogenase
MRELATTIAGHAPLTMRATKEALRRLAKAGHPKGDDLVLMCYMSADFREGMEAFLGKRAPNWQGRICISVTTTKAVFEVVLGADGILSAQTRPDTIVIDFSTTEIDVTRKLAEALAARGIAFLDAPVSGGPPAAEAGTLAIMAGGTPETVAAVRPLVERFGLFTHMGAVGAGQATKLVNQALCLTNYCIVAEGLRLAEAYGVDASKIPAALAPGLGNSAVLQAMLPRMVAQDFAPRGYARQVLKDLELLMEAGREHHLAMPMVAQATTMYRLLVAQGHSELDAIAVVKVLPEVTRAGH